MKTIKVIATFEHSSDGTEMSNRVYLKDATAEVSDADAELFVGKRLAEIVQESATPVATRRAAVQAAKQNEEEIDGSL